MDFKQAAKRPLAIRLRARSVIRSINAKPGLDTAASVSPTFNFFDLPRELRDEVYEHCLIFKQKFPSQNGARVRGRRIINPAMLLVSKQFRYEYTQRAEHHACLVIVDRPEFHGDLIKLPMVISYARKLELHLAIACDAPDHLIEQCRVLKEARMHRKWITDICDKMRFLDSLTIKLIIDPHQYIKTCEGRLLELLWKFTIMEELKVLEVWHCDYAGSSDLGWNFTKPRTLAMRWTAEKRELVRVKVAEASSAAKSKADETSS